MRKTVSLFAAALIAAASFGLGLAGALFLSGRLPGGGGAGPEPPSQGAKPAIERPDGIWHRARPELRASAEDMETMKELANLPYLDGYEPAPDLRDVTVHDPARAFDGLNLVVSAHAAQAALVDMDGRVLHTWQRPIEDVWPDLDFEGREGFGTFWRRACALPNGDLLAIYDRIGMIRLDRDSELIWANPGGYHHDLEVVPDGTIYTLARAEREEHDRLKLTGPIEEDFVAILAPEDGRELRRVSILDCFLNSDYQSVLAGARSEGDLMHVNTVERMDGRFAERHPLFAEGLVLISTPTLNTIATVDLERETVVWALGGMWRFQHQPTVVGDGHLLVFDNLGQDGSSKVIELDPRTQEVVWAYRGSPGRRFWSNFLGSCQRLPNGNTLVTESTAGRAFEVTPGGEIVWEYVNPHRAGEDESLIASLLEVVRMGRDDFSADFAVAHED
jgi:hypothetical protein